MDGANPLLRRRACWSSSIPVISASASRLSSSSAAGSWAMRSVARRAVSRSSAAGVSWGAPAVDLTSRPSAAWKAASVDRPTTSVASKTLTGPMTSGPGVQHVQGVHTGERPGGHPVGDAGDGAGQPGCGVRPRMAALRCDRSQPGPDRLDRCRPGEADPDRVPPSVPRIIPAHGPRLHGAARGRGAGAAADRGRAGPPGERPRAGHRRPGLLCRIASSGEQRSARARAR